MIFKKLILTKVFRHSVGHVLHQLHGHLDKIGKGWHSQRRSALWATRTSAQPTSPRSASKNKEQINIFLNKCSDRSMEVVLLPARSGNYDRQAKRPADRPTNQPTDGQSWSQGSSTSIKIISMKLTTMMNSSQHLEYTCYIPVRSLNIIYFVRPSVITVRVHIAPRSNYILTSVNCQK